MSKYIRELIFFLLGVIVSALVVSKCLNKQVIVHKETVLRKTDTIYKQVIVPKVNEYVREIIKAETLKIRDTLIIRAETTYAFNLYKYQFKDSILYISFLANYVDTNSFVYEIKYKPIKTKQYNNELGFILKQNSYEIFYGRRLFWNVSMIGSIEKDFYTNSFKIGIGIKICF